MEKDLSKVFASSLKVEKFTDIVTNKDIDDLLLVQNIPQPIVSTVEPGEHTSASSLPSLVLQPGLRKTYKKLAVTTKVKTVGSIRRQFEAEQVEILSAKLQETEYILSHYSTTKLDKDRYIFAIDKLIKQGNPLTRKSWKYLSDINLNKYPNKKQFIVSKGKHICLFGSLGGNIYEFKYDPAPIPQKSVPDSSLAKTYTDVQPVIPDKRGRKRGILARTDVKFKPGPLSKKPALSEVGGREGELGPVEVVHVPPLALEVIPRHGRPLPAAVRFQLERARPADGSMDEAWVQYATSLVGVQAPEQPPGKPHLFTLPYVNNQTKILMQKDLEFSHRMVSPAKVSNLTPIDDFTLNGDLENLDKCASTDEVTSTINTMLKEMLNAVTIGDIQDRIWKYDDDYMPGKDENLNNVSKSCPKKHIKRKYCELKRLDVTVIDLEEGAKEACGRASCSMGCVCASLRAGLTLNQHCGLPSCMLHCSCSFEKSLYNAKTENTSELSRSTVVNLQHQMNKYLSREEQKFRRTVICSNDQTIVMGACRRGLRFPKRFQDFCTDNNEVEKEKCLKSVQIIITRLPGQLSLEPWCMVHQLYRCFCKGLFTDGVPCHHSYTAKTTSPTTRQLVDTRPKANKDRYVNVNKVTLKISQLPMSIIHPKNNNNHAKSDSTSTVHQNGASKGRDRQQEAGMSQQRREIGENQEKICVSQMEVAESQQRVASGGKEEVAAGQKQKLSESRQQVADGSTLKAGEEGHERKVDESKRQKAGEIQQQKPSESQKVGMGEAKQWNAGGNRRWVSEEPLEGRCSRSMAHYKYINRGRKCANKYIERNNRIRWTEKGDTRYMSLLENHMKSAHEVYLIDKAIRKANKANQLKDAEETVSSNLPQVGNNEKSGKKRKNAGKQKCLEITKVTEKRRRVESPNNKLEEDECSESPIVVEADNSMDNHKSVPSQLVPNTTFVYNWKKLISDYLTQKIYLWVTVQKPLKIYITVKPKIYSPSLCVPISNQKPVPSKILDLHSPMLREVVELKDQAHIDVILFGRNIAWELAGSIVQKKSTEKTDQTVEESNTLSNISTNLDNLFVWPKLHKPQRSPSTWPLASGDSEVTSNITPEEPPAQELEKIDTSIPVLTNGDKINKNMNKADVSESRSLDNSHLINDNMASSPDNSNRTSVKGPSVVESTPPLEKSKINSNVTMQSSLQENRSRSIPTLKLSSTKLVPLPPTVRGPLINESKYRWLLLHVENDFTTLSVEAKNFNVTYDEVLKAMSIADKTGKTCRFPVGSLHQGAIPTFGIYAVPDNGRKEVFLGPYKMEEPTGIKTNLKDKKPSIKRTWGNWTRALDKPHVIVCNRNNSSDSAVQEDKSKKHFTKVVIGTSQKIMQFKANKIIQTPSKDVPLSPGQVGELCTIQEKDSVSKSSLINTEEEHVTKTEDIMNSEVEQDLAEENDDDVIFLPTTDEVVEISDSEPDDNSESEDPRSDSKLGFDFKPEEDFKMEEYLEDECQTNQVWFVCKNFPYIGYITATENVLGHYSLKYSDCEPIECSNADIAIASINLLFQGCFSFSPKNLVLKWKLVKDPEGIKDLHPFDETKLKKAHVITKNGYTLKYKSKSR